MANHCYNYAFFNGSKEDIQRAEKAILDARGSDESLWWETYKKVFGDKYDYSSEDVYKEFGSKWFDCEIETDGETMKLSGDSAWSPAVPFFQKLCETFNLSCEAEYEESGCDFGGWFECSRGYIIRDETVSYRLYRDICDPGDLLELIINDIEEGYYDSYEEFLSNTDSTELSRLSVREKEKIRNKIKSRNNEANTNK